MQQDYRSFGAYRLFLAWLVLTSHANAYLPGWVGQLALGNIGVFSFFVLSGFVIVEACDRFYRGAPHRFFLNRFLRIYPTYWGACALAVAAYLALGHQDLSGSAEQIVANLGIVHSPPGVFMWISIVWAVAIELRFYLIAGLVMGLAQRKPGIAVLVLGVAGCAALFGYIVTDASGYQILGTFRHAPFFILGAAGYFAIAYASRRARLLAIFAAPMSAHSFWQYNAAVPDLSELKLLLFASSVIALFLLARTSASAGSVPNDKKLGDFSYPLYLAHWPAIYLVENATALGGGAGYSLVMLLSIAFSALMVFGIDRPLMNLRDRVRRRRLYA
ncbi:MAG: acyltransferase [Rhodocyclaceae bacterium]